MRNDSGIKSLSNSFRSIKYAEPFFVHFVWNGKRVIVHKKIPKFRATKQFWLVSQCYHFNLVLAEKKFLSAHANPISWPQRARIVVSQEFFAKNFIGCFGNAGQPLSLTKRQSLVALFVWYTYIHFCVYFKAHILFTFFFAVNGQSKAYSLRGTPYTPICALRRCKYNMLATK